MSDQSNPPADHTLCDSRLPQRASLPPVTLDSPSATEIPQTRCDGDHAGTLPDWKRLGRFEVHGEIGRGGMGAVLRGRDPELGRELALKVLLAGHRGNSDAVRRFRDEAQIGGQLQHPGLVPVYELGADSDGRPFFAMKLVDGRTLGDLLQERKNCTDELPHFVTIYEQVSLAIGYAHARGVIHRDLKPANIMVGAYGEVQVMDWGLAKVLGHKHGDSRFMAPAGNTGGSTIRTARSESDGGESHDGAILGTPMYMPPEQARGEIERLDARADVFGLGGILCEILTGKPPFSDGSVTAILGQAARGDLSEAFSRLDRCGADPELIALAKQCLAAEPDARPADGAAVAACIAAYRAGVAARLHNAELAKAAAEVRAIEERRRRRVQAALGLTVFVLLLLVGAGVWWSIHQRNLRLEQEASDRAREERLETELAGAVDKDLAQAAELERDQKLGEAAEVLRHAAERVESKGSDTLRERVRAALRELALKSQLEEARLAWAEGKTGDFDPRGTDARYRKAFQNYGIDVETLDPEKAAERIMASPLREKMVLALDEWVKAKLDARLPNGERLHEAAMKADDNAWRRHLRETVRQRNWNDLRCLAEDVEPAKLPIDTLVRLGDALMTADLFNEAVDVLRRAQRMHPNDFWVNFKLGEACRQARPPLPQDAVRFQTAALALKPNNPSVHFFLGLALATNGNALEAEAEYTETVRLRPNFPSAHLNLGVIRAERGDKDGAIAKYRDVLRWSPTHTMALNNMAHTLASQGKLDEAAKNYREALRIQPTFSMARRNLIGVLKQQGKTEEAFALLQEGVRATPNDARARFDLALGFAVQKRHEEAVAEYQETVRLNPSYALAHNNLGFSLEVLGRLPEATASYRAALRSDPDMAMARSNLARVLRAQDKLDEVVTLYRDSVGRNPEDHNLHYNLGLALRDQGQFAEAEAAYREAIRLKPDVPVLHTSLGYALRRQGKLGESRDVYLHWGELLTKEHGPNHPGKAAIAEAERLADLERRLPEILDGKARAADAAEQIDFARVCAYKNQNAAAARFYAAAFLADPKLAEDTVHLHRYNAACAAALAASASSGDEAARLRAQCLGWLTDDLGVWSKRLSDAKPADRAVVEKKLRHWQADSDLAAVRDRKALDALPESERAKWQAFWTEVESLRKQGDH